MRIDLPDGQWAELRERPTTNQLNIVRRAILRAVDAREYGADVALAFIACYVREWHIVGEDGAEIPIARAGDVDDVLIDRISYEASELWEGRPDPKDSIPPSGSSQPA